MDFDVQPLIQDFSDNFLNVFLGVAVFVAFAYAVKALIMPSRPARQPVARKPKPTRVKRTKLARASQSPAPITQADVSAELLPLIAMPDEMQWQRAIAPVHSTIAHGRRAKELHQSAMTRLDAADYALQRLMDELAGVIALPARATANLPMMAPRFEMRHSLAA